MFKADQFTIEVISQEGEWMRLGAKIRVFKPAPWWRFWNREEEERYFNWSFYVKSREVSGISLTVNGNTKS